MHRTTLSSNWRFQPTDHRDYPRPHTRRFDWMPASIPGCIHTDLVNCGVICDPFVGKHEAGLAWIDETDWFYETEFEWVPKVDCPRRVLRFNGLDTFAVVFLNGDQVGFSDNFFIPLEVDVSDLLKDGPNQLAISFVSPVKIGEGQRRKYFGKEGIDWQTENFAEHAFVRKPAYMSGWDWGPRLVSAGIWAPVELLEFSSRILSFTVFTNRLPDGRYRVRTETEVEGEGALTAAFGDVETQGDLDMVIDEPKLWWPNGYGEPHLYKTRATIAGHRVEKKIGLREIKLVQEADSWGESFEFEVNGERVWAGGANWIPNDSFPSRITAEDYHRQVETCRDLNFNMLRVWGGGLYESEAFYNACDENGILVWQDFAYGCSYYADDDGACEVARKESEHHVRRLRDRACLALWCGNNENLAMWRERWGGKDASPNRYYGERIYKEVLPSVLQELNPQAPYIESSPCPGTQEDGVSSPNKGGSGDCHYWDVWHGRGDWKYYADSTARFSSEFGFASSCSRAQWDVALPGGTPQVPEDPTVRFHDKTLKPFELYRGYVELHYPHSETLDDWIYYSQLNQRDALRFGIEHFRSCGFCAGSLIWQFNDCWPVESWAVQDYQRLLKPAAYELQRLYAERAICILPEGNQWRLKVVSYRVAEEAVPIGVQFVSATSGKILSNKRPLVGKDGALLSWEHEAPCAVRVLIEGSPETERWFLTDEPKSIQFAQPSFSVSGDEELTLKVSGLAYDLVIEDADNPGNLPLEGKLKGSRAFTLVDDAIPLSFENRPRSLRLRSLAGVTSLGAPL